MPKAYWISCLRKIYDADKVAAYSKLAAPAIAAAGGKIIARANPALVYENGVKERTVIIEFEDVAAAQACHDSASYQAALKAFEGGVDRDLRIVEAVD